MTVGVACNAGYEGCLLNEPLGRAQIILQLVVNNKAPATLGLFYEVRFYHANQKIEVPKEIVREQEMVEIDEPDQKATLERRTKHACCRLEWLCRAA